MGTDHFRTFGGDPHSPITNILLANSIISRPTILPQHYRIALHTPTTVNRQQPGQTGCGQPTLPSLGDAPLRAGWLHACIRDPHPALRLNKCCRWMSHPACTTPSSSSNACDRDARCCVTRLAHHMKVGSPDSAPMRLGSSISNPLALISSVATPSYPAAQMTPICVADFLLPVSGCQCSPCVLLPQRFRCRSLRSEIENDSEDQLCIPQVASAGSAYAAHVPRLKSFAMGNRARGTLGIRSDGWRSQPRLQLCPLVLHVPHGLPARLCSHWMCQL